MPQPRVLIIEDDFLMRALLKNILREEGFALAGEAKEGEAGIEACELLNPDIVCLDIMLPDMSGLDVLKALREQNPKLRVVMTTADSSMETVREAISRGACGYIIKPFSPKRVATALKAALADHG